MSKFSARDDADDPASASDSFRIRIVIHVAHFTWATSFFFLVAGCAQKPEACTGQVTAESVAASVPVVEAFRAHLDGGPSTTDIGRYLSDFRNYDLAITTSDSEFEYEFIPRNQGHGFKGGGAYYTVSRKTGRIETARFEK